MLKRLRTSLLVSYLLTSLLVAASCGDVSNLDSLSGVVPPGPVEMMPGGPLLDVPAGPPMPMEGIDGPSSCGGAGVFCWAGSFGVAPSLHRVFSPAANELWIVGTKGTLLRFNGVSWFQLPVNSVTADLHGIWGSSSNDVWVVGDGGTLLHWDGTAFTAITTGTTSALNAVWGSSANDVWVVGDGGTLLRYDGTSWTLLKSGFLNRLHGVFGTSPNDVWIVGAWGLILRWNGTNWSSVASGITDSLTGIWGSGSRDIWTVGSRGALLHWDGTSWFDSSLSVNLTDIAGTSATNAWLVGENGTISAFAAGSFWGTNLNLTKSHLHSVISKGSVAWAVGDDGTILQWDNVLFSPIEITVPFSTLKAIWAVSRTELWALDDGARVLRYAGGAWSTISNPAGVSLEGVRGIKSTDVWFWGNGSVYRWDGTKLNAVTTPTPSSRIVGILPFGTNDVWLAKEDNRVFRFDGTTWTAMDSGRTGLGSLTSLVGTSSSDIWVMLGSRLWRYNGSIWSPVSTPVSLTPNWSSGPNDLWATYYNFIWRWNGTSWSRYSSRLTQDKQWRITGGGSSDIWMGQGDLYSILHYDGKSTLPANAPIAPSLMTSSGPGDLWISSGKSLYRR